MQFCLLPNHQWHSVTSLPSPIPILSSSSPYTPMYCNASTRQHCPFSFLLFLSHAKFFLSSLPLTSPLPSTNAIFFHTLCRIISCKEYAVAFFACHQIHVISFSLSLRFSIIYIILPPYL